MAADIGGIAVFLFRVLSVIVSKFSTLRLDALITARLFYLSQGAIELVDISKSTPSENLKEMGLNKLPTGEIRLDFPSFIDWEYLQYTFAKCFCFLRKKKKGFEQYQKLVDLGADNFKKDLDIVSLVRRIRSHGIALYYLTTSN